MTTKKKIAAVLLVFIVLLPGLLLLLNYLFTVFINRETLKTEISERFSRETGGAITYHTMDLAWFPSAHVIIHDADISFRENNSAAIQSIKVYPAILPLFRGDLIVSKVEIESPAVTVALEGPSEEAAPVEPKPTADRIRDILTSSLAAVAAVSPDLSLELNNGTIRITRNGQELISLYNVSSTVQTSPGESILDMRLDSKIGNDISITARFDRQTLRGFGEISLKQFRPETIMSDFFPDAALSAGDSDIDLTIRAVFDNAGSFTAGAEGRLSRLTLVRGDKTLVLTGSDLKAFYHEDRDSTAISLDTLKLDSPALEARGSLVVNKASSMIHMKIEATGIEVTPFRDIALSWKDDLPEAERIFSVIRGGRIPGISYEAEGTSFRDLVNEKYFVIRATMEKGQLFIPGPDLDLEDVSGKVAIADMVLTGNDLSGKTDGATGHNGILTLGLREEDSLFHLDIHMKADLARLHPFLKRVVHHKDFLNETGRMRDIKGSAAGRLVLGETLHDIGVRLEVSDLNMYAKYDRLPYPVTILSGGFFYDGSMVSIKDLHAKMGGSTFSGLSASLKLGKNPALTISSAASSLFMNEVYPWIMSYESIRNNVKNLKAVQGVLEVDSLRLKGPLLKPGEWDFTGSGRVMDLSITTPLLQDPLEISDGKFETTQDRLSLIETRMRTADASLKLSGVIRDYLEEEKKPDLTFDGTAGPGTVEQAYRLAGLPAELLPRSTVTVLNARLVRDSDSGTSFAGDLAVANGPSLSLDVAETPDSINIRKLTVKDEKSDASLSLILNARELTSDYTGTLARTTMENLFASPVMNKMTMDGDLHVHIARGTQFQFAAEGRLTAGNLYLPLTEDLPSSIADLSVEADRGWIIVKEARLLLADKYILAKGTVIPTEKGLRFALDASSDGIEWDILDSILEKRRPDRGRNIFSDMIDSGTIDFDSGSFSYAGETFKPFRGKLSLSGDTVHIDVNESELCSIAVTAAVDIDPEGVSVDVHPHADERELESTIECLFNVRQYMTGSFDLDGRVSGTGAEDTLTEHLAGEWTFNADKGRIYQYSLTAKVLAFINLTEIFRGQLPDILEEGFAYKSIISHGKISGSTLLIDEFIIDGASMKIVIQGVIDYSNRQTDLKVLVSPLKTVDFIIDKIPVIGYILGGNLITIPVRVTGDFKDPDMFYMNPADIGSELLDIMKKTLSLPIKIFEPLIPKEKIKGNKSDN